MKEKILIVDDSSMNREFLKDILCHDYDIILAKNGVEAISLMKNHLSSLALILLDLIMPEMDGFEVLTYMNKYQWIHDIPVMIISSENSGKYIGRVYDLGASDFISRPFNVNIVQKRVSNIISLYSKQRRLKDIVTEQIYEKESRSNLMISVLSHIVEFRNGESGLHIIHINMITEKLLYALLKKDPTCTLTTQDISLITMASSLHDIGKISISDKILNKPGRLTPEEFSMMKTHAPIGGDIIRGLKWNQDDPLLKVAYEICRWHHERWDGRGYPDGLKGHDIPLSAQVVSLADVYDALTSERCYKKAIPHKKAIQMIMNGECGQFQPLLLECLLDIEEELIDISSSSEELMNPIKTRETQKVVQELGQYDDLTVTRQVLDQLDIEKIKSQFFFDRQEQLALIYNHSLDILYFSHNASRRLELPEVIMRPMERDDQDSLKIRLKQLVEKAKTTTIDHPYFEHEFIFDIDGKTSLCHFQCSAIWLDVEDSRFIGLMAFLDREQLFDDEQVQEVPHLNQTQLQALLQQSYHIFDKVIFIDVLLEKSVKITDTLLEEMTFLEETSMWKPHPMIMDDACVQAYRHRSKVIHFDYQLQRIYYAISQYVEVDGKGYVMEYKLKLQDYIFKNDKQYQNMLKTLNYMQESMYLDGLTEVYNRRYLEDEMFKKEDVTALAMVDLDYFKEVNDQFGHLAGDQALQEVAHILKKNVRDRDAVIRYGGDEFMILFHHMPANLLEERLNFIRREVEKLVIPDYPHLKLTCTIGCACGTYQQQLLKQADKMMYQAKIQRNSVKIHYGKEEHQ